VQSSALTYLYTLATLAVTFVGFSALVLILRQTLGGQMSRLDVLITRIFIQLGFLVAAGAMLPPLLMLFALPAGQVWRIASAAVALPSLLFACTYPSRRRTASGASTPLVIWVDVVVILALSVLLLLNAAALLGGEGPGAFAGALTGILFVAGWAYLQALKTLLRHHHSHLTAVGPEVPGTAESQQANRPSSR
jgi:hypothetical protein